MSKAITIQDYVKSLSSASSLDSRSIIVTDSAGNPEKLADLRIMHRSLFVGTGITDLDECLTPGLHFTRGITTGTFPEGGKSVWMYCIVEVFEVGTDIVQRITRFNAKGMAIRYYDTVQKAFRSWFIISI